MPNLITEDQIEQALLGRLGAVSDWATLNCFTAAPATPTDGSGRTDKREVILRGPLHEAAQRLNPQLPESVTRVHGQLHGSGVVSIHAPTWGATATGG